MSERGLAEVGGGRCNMLCTRFGFRRRKHGQYERSDAHVVVRRREMQAPLDARPVLTKTDFTATMSELLPATPNYLRTRQRR